MIILHFFMPALFTLAACLTAILPTPVMGEGLSLTDAMQRQVTFPARPQRVVCLAPYITEMMVGFGLEHLLAGVSREDLLQHSRLRTTSIGSYFNPDVDTITGCRPDLIIAAPSHEAVIRHFSQGDCRVMVMEAGTLKEGFFHMEMIGRLFGCEDKAAAIVRRNREQIALVGERLKAVPAISRKRVARVMAGENSVLSRRRFLSKRNDRGGRRNSAALGKNRLCRPRGQRELAAVQSPGCLRMPSEP